MRFWKSALAVLAIILAPALAAAQGMTHLAPLNGAEQVPLAYPCTVSCYATTSQIASLAQFNIVSYGAVGDEKTLTDGAVATAAPTAFTSASATFTPADIGKTIIIDGAGAGGTYLDAKITAVPSAHAITLSANVSTTVTGATYRYGAENHAAWSSAIAAVNAQYAASGIASCVAVPAGNFLIDASVTAFAEFVPGCVVGQGPFQSIVNVGPNLSGALLSWSEAWGVSGFSTSYSQFSNHGGPVVMNIGLYADTENPVQDAIRFNDRNDEILIMNVDEWGFTGSCLSLGAHEINQSVAYVRESNFYNIRQFYCGNASNASTLISSLGSINSQDATNELQFFGLNIFASGGVGTAINNNYTQNTVRAIRMYGLRIESPGKDALDIGDSTLTGQVAYVSIYGLETLAVPTGYYGVEILANSPTYAPYTIYVDGNINVSNGGGINVASDGGELVFHIHNMQTTQTNVTVANSTNVYGKVTFDGDGSEPNWTNSIDASSLKYVRMPTANYGNLSTSGLTLNGGPYAAAGTALPACSSTYKGFEAYVSDATSPTYNATYSSGGSVVAKVFCNGSNWITP